MTAAFAPLALPAGGRSNGSSAFRLKVLPQATTAPAFKAFQTAPAPVAPPPQPPKHEAHKASSPPKVTLQRDGERVTHIRVECSCGEVFELACEYS